MKRSLGGLLLVVFAVVLPASADDRYERYDRHGQHFDGWEERPRWHQPSYDYDPRSPYSQHPLYPPQIRRHDPYDERFSRDGRSGLQRWRKKRHYDDWPDSHQRHRYPQRPQEGFHYGPYRSYPAYPSYRYYRQ